MKVIANFPTYVEVEGKQAYLAAGESADVDGRKYNADHFDVKHGTLSIEQDDKPKRGRKAKAENELEQEPQPDQDSEAE